MESCLPVSCITETTDCIRSSLGTLSYLDCVMKRVHTSCWSSKKGKPRIYWFDVWTSPQELVCSRHLMDLTTETQNVLSVSSISPSFWTHSDSLYAVYREEKGITASKPWKIQESWIKIRRNLFPFHPHITYSLYFLLCSG